MVIHIYSFAGEVFKDYACLLNDIYNRISLSYVKQKLWKVSAIIILKYIITQKSDLT